MTEHFLTYEQSLAVKELGFDERCLKMSEHKKLCPEHEKPNGCQLHNIYCGYPDCTIDKTITPIPLPLKSQFFKWVRHKYKLLASVQYFTGGYYCYTINDMQETKESNRLFTEFETYEQAEDDCINKIIELLKLK